jgi:hypothetical protein
MMASLLMAILLSYSLSSEGSIAMVRHRIDSLEVGVDTVPPTKPAFTVKSIRRGVGPRPGPEGMYLVTGDDNGGVITFVVQSEDDRSRSFEIGYVLRFNDGLVPEKFEFSDEAWRTLGCGGMGKFKDCLLFVPWIDGATDDQEAFDFSFTAVAIDKAGNESEPGGPFRVRDPGRVPEPTMDVDVYEFGD